MRTNYFLDHKLGEVLTSNPLQPKLAAMLTNVIGMTTPLITGIINGAVTCMEGDEVYLEVGCCQGASLIGALMGNDKRAVVVDNFSQFTGACNLEAFEKNIRAHGVEERIAFYQEDSDHFFVNPPAMKVGVYYYDGDHGYNPTYDGIYAAIPHLVYGALIVVDDTNWDQPSLAIESLLHDKYDQSGKLELVFQVKTHDHPNLFWHNGLAILTWNYDRCNKDA